MARQTLDQALYDQYEELLLRQADTIHDWPVGKERIEQAAIHVRTALLDQIRGRISQGTLCRVYSTLSFVMPDDAALEGEATPLAELEQEADWETAYHEQLERQTCPECGDGICPAGD